MELAARWCPRPVDVEELAAACDKALTLGKGFSHQVPSQEQWLAQTMAIIEEGAA